MKLSIPSIYLRNTAVTCEVGCGKSVLYKRFPVRMCATWHLGGDASWWKEHEGNTAVAAVVTAYLCWSKHGQRNRRIGVPADYYYLLCTLYHTRTTTLLSTTIYFYQYYTRTATIYRWRPHHRVVISPEQERAWEETILPRSWKLYLFVLKVVTCLASCCGGNNFPSLSNL